MRRSTLIAFGVVALLANTAAPPAFAGYGALAHDDATGKYGLSSNEETQAKAEDVGGKCYLDFNSGQMCAAFGQPSDP